MGHHVTWIDEHDDVSSIDFSDSLFFTEGGGSRRIPVRSDCKYIVHNPLPGVFDSIKDNVLVDQIYSRDVLARDVEVVYEPFYFEKNNSDGFKTLYHPWCSDVDPTEVEHFTKNETLSRRKREVTFVGTVYPPGEWSNINELTELAKACERYSSPLRVAKAVGRDHMNLMRDSWIAPAVQGQKSADLQLAVSRPYKISSYGRVPCTNSSHVYEVLEGFAGYAANIAEAVDKTVSLEESMSDNDYRRMVELVTGKFSYRNQVEVMISLL
jgi:hypothetical protein